MFIPNSRFRNKNGRPLEVSFLAWVFIFFGVVSLLIELWAWIDSDAREIMMALGFSRHDNSVVDLPLFVWMISGLVEAVVMLPAAVGLLFARNWARWLFLIAQAASTLLWWLVTGFPAFIVSASVLIYLVFLVVLLNPRSRAYFSGSAPQ